MGKSEATIKTLWGVAKSPELRLSDEELHLIVEKQTGKASIRSLSRREIAQVVSYLYRMKDSMRHRQKDRRQPAAGNEPTANQRRKIYRLTEDIGWNHARLRGLCRRMFGTEAVEWLNYKQCSDLIEALKAISKREEVKGHETGKETV